MTIARPIDIFFPILRVYRFITWSYLLPDKKYTILQNPSDFLCRYQKGKNSRKLLYLSKKMDAKNIATASPKIMELFFDFCVRI